MFQAKRRGENDKQKRDLKRKKKIPVTKADFIHLKIHRGWSNFENLRWVLIILDCQSSDYSTMADYQTTFNKFFAEVKENDKKFMELKNSFSSLTQEEHDAKMKSARYRAVEKDRHKLLVIKPQFLWRCIQFNIR